MKRRIKSDLVKDEGPLRGNLASDVSDFVLAALNDVDEVIYVADPETYDLLWGNSAFWKVCGEYSTGSKCYEILQQRSEPCPFCTNDKIFGEYLGQSYVWEFQYKVNGNWYRCSDKAIYWKDGRMVRFEIAADINEQKKAEEALRESESKLQDAHRMAGLGYWYWDVKTGEVEWSEGVYKIFKLDPRRSNHISIRYWHFLRDGRRIVSVVRS